ncbi:MAG: outer membrane protein assembly factor BamE [Alphaproteobacteria bacterium]|jgi:outer membrane protein assembly factor BamE (lipoprotein component of BamABCDE complex)|nr:MAG: outer membrane protein assembly factor BamE [Alphaproteobacteria bacterium]
MRRLFSARGAGGCRAAVSLARAYPGLRSVALAALVGIACTACAETVTKHGHLFKESELTQITPGMSSEQVKTSLGTPTTTASVGSGSAFYYISSVEGQSMFFAPTEKDRRVVAVYFSSLGAVDRVAQYGLKDGKVFDYVKNETPAHARDEGILKSLFRNLGIKQFGLD